MDILTKPHHNSENLLMALVPTKTVVECYVFTAQVFRTARFNGHRLEASLVADCCKGLGLAGAAVGSKKMHY